MSNRPTWGSSATAARKRASSAVGSAPAALGMARAMEHQKRAGCAIAFIGDGGMTAGMAFA